MGFDKMTWAWELKMMTKVKSSPHVVTESNLWMKVCSKYSMPFSLTTKTRVAMPPAKGMTTKRKTLIKRTP